MGLITSCFIAAGLLLLLLLWLGGKAANAHEGQGSLMARQILSDLHLDLPSRAAMERIFNSSDLEFVSRRAPANVRKLFLEERRRLARIWLSRTREQVRDLFRFHVLVARADARLRPANELRLAAAYLSFAASYWVLWCLIVTRGPFAARRSIRFVAGVAEGFRTSSEQILSSISAESLEKIRTDWVRESGLS